MKKQKLKSKLSLNKETLANLTKGQMHSLRGGETIDCGETFVPTGCQAPSINGGTQSWCACY
jgi:hypothetical protein